MSTRRFIAPAIALLAATSVLASIRAPALALAQGEADSAQADDYFRKGKALVKQGRLEEAYRAYRAGYEIRKGYDLAGNLGNVELELGKHRDAAEHLALCLRIFPATGTAKQLDFIRGRLADARREVGALSLKVSEGGAEVTIDGRSIGRSPFADEVFVDPGDHAVEARLSGYEPARRAVSIGRGASAEVDLALTPIAAPPPPQPLPLPLPTASVTQDVVPHLPPKRSATPLIVGASAAAVGVVFGVAGLVASNGAASSARAQQDALLGRAGPSACLDPANRASCDALDRDFVHRSTFRTVSVVGFAVAGAAAAGTLVYALIPGEKRAPATVQAGVAVAPGGAGIGLSGRF